VNRAVLDARGTASVRSYERRGPRGVNALVASTRARRSWIRRDALRRAVYWVQERASPDLGARRRRDMAAPFRLLDLPPDLIGHVAAVLGQSAIVVAWSTRGSENTRRALRLGVDQGERARFGGRGLTVRDAERLLRTRFGYDDELASRLAAGTLLGKLAYRTVYWSAPPALQQHIESGMVEWPPDIFERMSLLLSYGATVDRPVRAWYDENGSLELPLNAVAGSRGWPRALEMAEMLLAAGADPNARTPGDVNTYLDVTPLTRTLSGSASGWEDLDATRLARFRLASLLIDRGAMARDTNDDFDNWCPERHDEPRQSTLQTLRRTGDHETADACARLLDQMRRTSSQYEMSLVPTRYDDLV